MIPLISEPSVPISNASLIAPKLLNEITGTAPQSGGTLVRERPHITKGRLFWRIREASALAAIAATPGPLNSHWIGLSTAARVPLINWAELRPTTATFTQNKTTA